MRSTRIFVAPPLEVNQSIVLDAASARHVTTVLRLGRGEPLVLFDGRGGEYQGEIVALAKNKVTVAIGQFSAIERESSRPIHLVQAISRGERMDYTLQKAVELGVTSIAPVTAARTVARLDPARAEKRLMHWRQVVVSACEQCGRNRVPTVATIVSLDRWLAAQPTIGPRLILSGTASKPLPMDIGPEAITVLAGPEGGFSQSEYAAAATASFQPVRLGPRILRTETAALVALSILQSQYGDLTEVAPQ